MARPDDPPRRLDESDLRDWLRLSRSENIGPITFHQLIARFGTARDALEAAPDLARKGGRSLRLASERDIDREFAAAATLGIRLIASAETDYPAPLRAIDDAPPVIAVAGDPATLRRPAIGVVGSRNASAAGRKMATMLADGLGRGGFVIASGLARGIDGVAHRASLESGTIAVLAGGLDRIYPPEHVELAETIVTAGGALVSEMPLGWTARGRDFPRRNRIISGLSLAVVVVEAAQRSGTLITARTANEQGRPVFAVPGSPLDPRAAGTNMLLRQGATLVTEANDILSDVTPMMAREPDGDPFASDEMSERRPATDADGAARHAILEALGPTPVSIDDIIRLTDVPVAVVHLVLMELDLAGRLERHPGQRVSLVG